MIDAYLLRPLPVRNPGELVVIGSSNRASGSIASAFLGLPTVRDLAARTDLFQGAAATTIVLAAARPADGEPAERGLFLGVTGNYFSLLGVSPSLGRVMTVDDDTRRERVIVLGHRAWSTRFGSDPGVVGRTIRLNTVEFVVIGVAPGNSSEPTISSIPSATCRARWSVCSTLRRGTSRRAGVPGDSW